MTNVRTTNLILITWFYMVNIAMAAEWPPQEWLDVITPVADKCIQEVGIDPNVVQEARKGVLPNDDNLKNYLLCVFNSFELIDKQHHEFEFWKVLTMIPKEMKKPVFELGKGCLHINGEDYPKACLDFVKCMKQGHGNRFSFMF